MWIIKKKIYISFNSFLHYKLAQNLLDRFLSGVNNDDLNLTKWFATKLNCAKARNKKKVGHVVKRNTVIKRRRSWARKHKAHRYKLVMKLASRDRPEFVIQRRKGEIESRNSAFSAFQLDDGKKSIDDCFKNDGNSPSNDTVTDIRWIFQASSLKDDQNT